MQTHIIIPIAKKEEKYFHVCVVNLDERFDSEIELDSRYVDIFEQLRFDFKAFLFLGERSRVRNGDSYCFCRI